MAPHLATWRFDVIMSKHGSDAYAKVHRMRYLGTLRALEPFLRQNMTALEVGSKGSLMTELLRAYDLGITVDHLEGDLRYPWRLPRRSYSLLLCMEAPPHPLHCRGCPAFLAVLSVYVAPDHRSWRRQPPRRCSGPH